MKKILVLLCFVSFSGLFANAQSVMGIERLTPKEDVFQQLKTRYGILRVHDEGDHIFITDPTMGSFQFKLGFMYMDMIDGVSKFNGASFQTYFNPTENAKAKEERDYLLRLIRQKYEDELYVEFENGDGFKCCEFGNDPRTNRPIGNVKLIRDQGKDGVDRLYLILTYFQFVDTMLDDF